MINWELLKHPLNWIIVLLMLVIAGAAGHLALSYFGADAAAAPLPTTDDSMAGPSRKDFALAALGD